MTTHFEIELKERNIKGIFKQALVRIFDTVAMQFSALMHLFMCAAGLNNLYL